MREALDRLWRTVATGFCFAAFGLGGLLLRLIAFPLLHAVLWRPSTRAVAAKWLVHQSFRFFVLLLRGTGVLSLEVRGAERLRRRGLLIVANHPSLVDVVFLIALVRRADCIVRSGLARNPFTRGPVQAAGYLCNDSGAGLVDDCIASLQRGNNLIIFPEGTRTPLTGAVPLQRGAAHVAVRGAVNLTPVRIRCQPPMLTKGVPWYRAPLKRGRFVLDVCDDIAVAPFIAQSRSPAIATRQLTDHLTHYFSLEMHRAVD